MSLTVIHYADTVRLAVMADARLGPSHTIPASRWPTVVEQLVSKIDQEIAKITAKAHLAAGTIPKIITTPESTAEHEDSRDLEQSNVDSGMLRPPATIATSPPPIRRRIVYN